MHIHKLQIIQKHYVEMAHNYICLKLKVIPLMPKTYFLYIYSDGPVQYIYIGLLIFKQIANIIATDIVVGA